MRSCEPRPAPTLPAMDSKTVYLSPEQLQEQGLPPLTLCGGPVAPYRAASSPHLQQTDSMSTTPPSPEDRKLQAMARLGQAVEGMSQESIDAATRVAANLLAIRAGKQAAARLPGGETGTPVQQPTQQVAIAAGSASGPEGSGADAERARAPMFESDKFLRSMQHDNPLRPRFTIKPAEYSTMLEIVFQGQRMEVPISEILSFAARWNVDQDERAALGPPGLRLRPYPIYDMNLNDPDLGEWWVPDV